MSQLVNRLHHTAYTTRDLEATRAFYEDVLGFPLVATYCEKDELFGKERVYCHCFFAMKDGSALAFFQFADPADADEFSPPIPESPFHHIALQVEVDAQADTPGQRLQPVVEVIAPEGEPRLERVAVRARRDVVELR